MCCAVKRTVPILLALALCACSNNAQTEGGVNNSASSKSSSSVNNIESTDSGRDNTISGGSSTNAYESGDIIEQGETLSPKTFPRELEEIPSEYFNAANKQGTLVDLNYTTYESFSYEEKSQELQKRAVVYLPYGYNEQEKYNVFYLMHGGWSNETTTLGTPEEPAAMKNVLDNAIADGKIPPLIVVCPTYNNTSGEDSASYSLALQLTRNYHNELINDLIPAVEGKYSSYAESTSAEDLIAARDHRGFGGFSMGSVTTWRTFEYCLDYFRYFAPSETKGVSRFQMLIDKLPGEHKARWFAGVALNSSDQAMASVMSTALSRLNSFIDSELEQILCFDTSIDVEEFCNRKSAIYLVLPEENQTKHFLVSLILQQIYREMLTVADEKGGQLDKRVMIYADELGTLPKIEGIEMMFSASRSRKISIVAIIQSLAQFEKTYGKEGAEIIVDNCQCTLFGAFAPNSKTAEAMSQNLGKQTVLSGSVTRSSGRDGGNRQLQMIERPLMTVDELKSIPKSHFIVMKTGCHPMKTRLKLFFK